ncbi:hypothetical protein SASPL_145310 [Salvia splendens]|uniref:Uncharacterized protein n=1 Tax=Salvia splendens TaxID=180675 RepID=A0A8X8WHA8_SALSN|nr:hypothetical protein SASPL_145310 [Salvia splendens]
MHAAKNGFSEVVRALLDAGAPWNALTPSNLSAGDFAMDNGHQSAFDVLLNAGILAELVLGTIAMKDNGKGNPNGDYLDERVTFSEDILIDAESKAIMMAWERPLMEAHEMLGYSTQLIPLPVKDCLGEETWEGVKHKYWQLDTYSLPVCQSLDDSDS